MANANALVAQLDQNEAEYRVAPHNLDAEQALLGAIIVNNEAYYRVSDFLEPEHFYEDLHRRIFEVTSSLIKAGKVATPITLKTFLGDQDLGGITVSQYLARLAASPPRSRSRARPPARYPPISSAPRPARIRSRRMSRG